MRAYFIQIIAGGILALTLVQLYTFGVDVSRERAPATDWMDVIAVVVPDHIQGTDPSMIYDRIIHRAFNGDWVAEAQRFQNVSGGFAVECTGSNRQDYTPDDVVPDDVKLSWYMYNDCDLQVGTYRICTSWTMHLPNHPNKVLRKCSPPFDVLAVTHNGG